MNNTGAKVRKVFMSAAFCFATVSVAGCGVGDVQFEGKIFDAVGLNQKASRETPKLAERQPLVLPPSAERLPQPGAEGQSHHEAALSTAIRDPEAEAKKSEDIKEAEQKAFCDKHYDHQRAMADPHMQDIRGPHGSCRKSILDAVNINSGN